MEKVKGDTGIRVLQVVLAILLIACGVLIARNSGAEGEQSASESLRVTEWIARLTIPDLEEKPPEEREALITSLHKFVRKAAHFLEFALLGFLAMLLTLTFRREDFLMPFFSEHGIRYLLAYLICVLYAGVDELHQLFVSGRAGQIMDVGIDALGALCGVGAAFLFGWLLGGFLKRRKEKRLQHLS